MEQAEDHSYSPSNKIISSDNSSTCHSLVMSPSSGSDSKSPSLCHGYIPFRIANSQNLRKVETNVKDKVSPVGTMPLSAIPLVSSNIANVKLCQLSFQRPVIVVKRICRNVSSDNVAV